MTVDVLLQGGFVVDGSGRPGATGDVAIQGDRIEHVGRLNGATAREVIDCTGLVVAPGFIDIHTHYDPQILWDPALTPSCWYGVTTVVMGNCGFSIAPTRPEHRPLWVETMENVEAMSRVALDEGISWEFESFEEYLDTVERRRPLLNVSALVGHTALRLYAMGEAAFDRVATETEVADLVAELETALAAGAIGFATSRSPAHVGVGGRPIPSRQAAGEEIEALVGALKHHGSSGVFQIVGGPGFSVPEFEALAAIAGRPVTWCSLHEGVQGGQHWALSDATDSARSRGAALWAQMSCLPVISQFTLARPYVLESVPSFGRLSTLGPAERIRHYRDPAWRSQAHEEIVANRESRTFAIDFARMHVAETGLDDGLLGRSIADLADERSMHPMDLFLDLALDDELRTRFDLTMFNSDEDAVAGLLQRESTILGLSDAGAHTSQLCDASFAVHLLGRFVRERKDFSLEFAVWRLTGHPAEVFGFQKRGHLTAGYVADVCVFNPATIGEGNRERVFDQPGGADRVIKRPTGIEHVFVNGVAIRRDGQPIDGVAPGKVLR